MKIKNLTIRSDISHAIVKSSQTKSSIDFSRNTEPYDYQNISITLKSLSLKIKCNLRLSTIEKHWFTQNISNYPESKELHFYVVFGLTGYKDKLYMKL